MFCNILVSVDGSPHADKALTEAIDIAIACRSRLTILTAVPRAPGWVSTPATAAAAQQLAIDLERESDQILRAAVDRVPASVPVTKILTHKPIRDALAAEIKSGRHDLLVMGSRGRGTLAASLLGSVSAFALHHCSFPVLIVHCEKEKPEPTPARERKATSDALGRVQRVAPS
jgi:nucleotide-binding universal stress UspA family protein